MKALATLFAILACALLPFAHAGAQEAPAHKPAPQTANDPAQRQLLVMLRLPARHYRPDGAYGSNYTSDSGRNARRRVAFELAAAHGLRLRDSWPMPAIGIDCFLMEELDDRPLDKVLDALAHDARVAWAQPLADYHALDAGAAAGWTAGTADPLYPVQPAAHDWHLAELQRVSTGRKVTVAVVDSGVDAAHPDLAGQLSLRRNFVDEVPDAAEAHGTAVAGIIGARSGNGIGIAGIAPGARLMALRACWETGRQPARCNTLTLAKAINFALENRAQVINLSLGGPPDRLLQALLDAALARGIVVIGAADPQRPDGGFPASWAGVIAVARTGDRHPPGTSIRYAPGTDVPSCVPDARFGLVSGSSYAAAHVAGLAALMAELRPGIRNEAIRRAFDGGATMVKTSTQAAPPLADKIDACAALARVADACVCLCTSTAATKLAHPR